MSIYGNPVMLGGSGGGGVPLLSRAAWDALSTAQKQSYGLVAVQDANSGFYQGELYYGASFFPFTVIQSGWGGASSASVTLEESGDYYLLVIALNSEASTKNLTVGATLNGSALTGTSLAFNQYYGSGDNRRNYRVMLFPLSGTSGDTVDITLTDRSSYSSFVYAVLESGYLTIDKQLSTPDNSTSGTNSSSGMVVYGTFNGGSSGTINLLLYNSGNIVSTTNPGISYTSSYIFWFV